MAIVSSYTIATIISLQTISTCFLSAAGQYIYAFYLQTYTLPLNGTQNLFNITDPINLSITINDDITKCMKNDVSTNSAAQAWAQQKSADLLSSTTLWSSLPIIIMTYILGLYTPQLGKRFVLILTMLGTTVQVLIWLFIIYFLLDTYWWYIAAFIAGLSGSDNVRGFVLNLIITENTTEDERSYRFVLFGAITMIVSSLSIFATGYYIAWRGFTDLFWTSVILQLFCIFIVIHFFKTKQPHQKILSSSPAVDTFLPSSTIDMKASRGSCHHCFDIFTVFQFKNRSHKQSISLLLTLLAYTFHCFVSTSFTVFLWYLLNAPFCLTSKDIGNLSAAASISSGILSIVGMKILTYAGASDITICIVSQMCFSVVFIWLSLARYTWQLYVGVLINSFTGYQFILTVSMMSKWLKPDERNNAFTCVTEISTIIITFGTIFFNWVYARTVVNYRIFTFLLAAGLNLIPLILNICLWLVTRLMPDEQADLAVETDKEPIPAVPSNSWPPEVLNTNCLMNSQRLVQKSRSNSKSSNDYNRIETVDADIL